MESPPSQSRSILFGLDSTIRGQKKRRIPNGYFYVASDDTHQNMASDLDLEVTDNIRKSKYRYITCKGIRFLFSLILLGLFIRIVVWHRRTSALLQMKPLKIISAPMHLTTRTCPNPSYPTLLQGEVDMNTKIKICIVTLTDEGRQRFIDKLFSWRNYKGILALTWKNKQSYADKYNYMLYDESSRSIDTRRQVSWSKVPATLRLIRDEACDWVFWFDADTVIMNSKIRIESFLPQDTQKHLLLSPDTAKSAYNAGAWLIRNSPWSIDFLEQWYRTHTLVLPTGTSNHGDNDALNKVLARMDADEFSKHVAVTEHCTFNSFGIYSNPEAYTSIMSNIENFHWYNKTDYYFKGDFIVHVAGTDNKVDALTQYLALAE